MPCWLSNCLEWCDGNCRKEYAGAILIGPAVLYALLDMHALGCICCPLLNLDAVVTSLLELDVHCVPEGQIVIE